MARVFRLPVGKSTTVRVSAAQRTVFDARLDPELGSVVAARRLVQAAVMTWGLADAVADGAVLCVSELVTNAVLHAGTEVVVSVSRLGDGARIEVGDGRRRLPTLDPEPPADLVATHSMTGRGLAVVAALADRWGVDEAGPAGKIAWAEIGVGRAPGPDLRPGAILTPTGGRGPGRSDRPSRPRSVDRVWLGGVPVRLLAESAGQFADRLREVQVIALDPSRRGELDGLAEVGRQLALSMGVLNDQGARAAEVARSAGLETADVEVVVADDARAAFADLRPLLRELERWVAGLPLLSLPASAEVERYRRWCAEEVARQLAGAAPRPYPFGPTPRRDGSPGGSGCRADRVAPADRAQPLAGSGQPPRAALHEDHVEPPAELAAHLPLHPDLARTRRPGAGRSTPRGRRRCGP